MAKLRKVNVEKFWFSVTLKYFNVYYLFIVIFRMIRIAYDNQIFFNRYQKYLCVYFLIIVSHFKYRYILLLVRIFSDILSTMLSLISFN